MPPAIVTRSPRLGVVTAITAQSLADDDLLPEQFVSLAMAVELVGAFTDAHAAATGRPENRRENTLNSRILVGDHRLPRAFERAVQVDCSPAVRSQLVRTMTEECERLVAGLWVRQQCRSTDPPSEADYVREVVLVSGRLGAIAARLGAMLVVDDLAIHDRVARWGRHLGIVRGFEADIAALTDRSGRTDPNSSIPKGSPIDTTAPHVTRHRKPLEANFRGDRSCSQQRTRAQCVEYLEEVLAAHRRHVDTLSQAIFDGKASSELFDSV
jgi:hypothetical protein